MVRLFMKDGFIYVFQNFIYVPIVSAIIGAVFSIIVPQIGAKIWAKIKKKIDKKVDIIDISGKWNSFFHEGDIIQSETIELNQDGQIINGEIVLDERKYKFPVRKSRKISIDPNSLRL